MTATRKITLVIEGDDFDGYEEALSEATRLINQGNLSGHNASDNGAFYFNSTTDVPECERPAR